MRILSVSSSRADVGLLSGLWALLSETPDIDLHILLTGMHCRPAAATPATPARATIHRGGADMGGGEAAPAAHAMAACTTAAAEVIAAVRPDWLVLLGDRLDMVTAAIAALPFNIPLAHIHGGDVSLGAVDDRVRHAISKLAHLHFAASVPAASRLTAMGEEPWRIHVVGAPGLDALMQAPELERAEFLSTVCLPVDQIYRLVCVHPETNAADPIGCARAVLAALEQQPGPTLLTAPNSDPGGAEILAMIQAFVARHAWAVFRDTLGTRLYANALRHAAVVLGNSSSGIIEAGAFGVPAINVGTRQDGRDCAENVLHVDNDVDAVVRVLSRTDWKRAAQSPSQSLYGDGQASRRMVEIIRSVAISPALLTKVPPAMPTTPFQAPWQHAA